MTTETGAVPPEDVATFTDHFVSSGWARVDVRIGDWELRLARSQGVPGFCVPLTREVGSAELADCIAIVAPHVATVRLAPAGRAPYATLGDRVGADTRLCDLEVMRSARPLLAGIAGCVRRICVADGALVEAGQPLFFVARAG